MGNKLTKSKHQKLYVTRLGEILLIFLSHVVGISRPKMFYIFNKDMSFIGALL
jgi:hypothetical protein